MISYAPFWHTLKERGVSQYRLITTYEVSSATLDSLRKNRGVTLNTLGYLCWILDCDLKDVVEFGWEEKKKAEAPEDTTYHSPEPGTYLLPSISYAPFWITLKEKKISQYQLIRTYMISSAILDSMRKNKNLTMNTLDRLCEVLKCGIEKIVKLEWK